MGGGLNRPRAFGEQEGLAWKSGLRMGLGKLALSPFLPHSHLSFQVLGIIFSCCLVKSIRSGYEVM